MDRMFTSIASRTANHAQICVIRAALEHGVNRNDDKAGSGKESVDELLRRR